MNVIETKNLTKYYGKSRGIIDVSLAVERGDFFGFIGPNGAGKSTLIRTLLGLISPTSGEATVLGFDIVKNKTDILKDIGYLPSEAAFYGNMKVSEIIEFSAKIRGVDCRDEAKKLCERLDLDTTKKIRQLSLGNRKKVGIVCALQHKPSLYILDEPTSGLDPLIQNEFYKILKERNDEGATIFLSSHILSEVGKYCKRAAVIREGRLLVCDDVSNLSKTGIKKVNIKGITEVPEIEGAVNVKFDGDTLTFIYQGHIRDLISTISSMNFEDVNISDPELDEAFMHYYVKEEK